MKTTAVVLVASLVCAAAVAAADGPRSVLTDVHGRPVYGWMEGGLIRFYPAEQTPENLAASGAGVGDALANGVLAQGLHDQRSGTFKTNSADFDPARCNPAPCESPPAINVAAFACGICGLIALFLAVVIVIALKPRPDPR